MGRRHPVDDGGCIPAPISSDLMRIRAGRPGGSVLKDLHVNSGGQGRTAQPDRGTRLGLEERLRDPARDVDGRRITVLRRYVCTKVPAPLAVILA